MMGKVFYIKPESLKDIQERYEEFRDECEKDGEPLFVPVVMFPKPVDSKRSP